MDCTAAAREGDDTPPHTFLNSSLRSAACSACRRTLKKGEQPGTGGCDKESALATHVPRATLCSAAVWWELCLAKRRARTAPTRPTSHPHMLLLLLPS